MSSFLPANEGGYLPYFLIWQAVSAMIHGVVCYTAPAPTAMKAFSGERAPAPAHPLLAHVYAVKNMYTGLIRLTAAYNITNQPVYDLGIATFAGVLLLYVPETFVYRTARMKESLFPFVLAGTSLVWMLAQRSFYLEG